MMNDDPTICINNDEDEGFSHTSDEPNKGLDFSVEKLASVAANVSICLPLKEAPQSWGWNRVIENYPFVLEQYAPSVFLSSWFNSATASFRVVTADGFLVVTSDTMDKMMSFWNTVLMELNFSHSTLTDSRFALTVLLRALQATKDYRTLLDDWTDIGAPIFSSPSSSSSSSSSHPAIMEDVLRERMGLLVQVPYNYCQPLENIQAHLKCVSCGEPAVEPVLQDNRTFCTSCLAQEISVSPTEISQFIFSSPNPSSSSSSSSWQHLHSLYIRAFPRDWCDDLDALLVSCPFSQCNQHFPRGRILSHCRQCPHAELPCPMSVYGCRHHDHHSLHLLQHVLRCPRLRNDAALLAEQRGPFATTGKDVLQHIMSFLDPPDVLSLSQVNRWFAAQVRETYRFLQCTKCGFFHRRGPLEFHPGKWGDLTYFDVSHHRKSTLRLDDHLNKAKVAGKKTIVVSLAAAGGVVLGSVVAAPLVALGVLFKSGDIIANAVSIPVRIGAVFGAAAYEHTKKMRPTLTRWTCCNQEGSFAVPCKRCHGDEVEDLPLPPTAEEEDAAQEEEEDAQENGNGNDNNDHNAHEQDHPLNE